ncbi:energy transducer TonB [Dyella terrae]|jgi:acylphosphatase|uniref:energy transducer TonB n=1 Tax=Dyella terrae TaxID=522259 RepID=UPI001EFDBE77|nr:energy transducer TonB [Dyella terrae]ULU26808.1 TonB protein C-terminal protein [Dyella terrae]
MMRRLVVLLGALLLMSNAFASATEEVAKKQIESSMLVSGTVEINPDGSVRAYAIDQAKSLGPALNEFIRQAVMTWKFRIDTKEPVIAKAKMTLRLVAKSVDEKHDTLTIGSSSIGESDEAPSDSISWDRRLAPTYPKAAMDSGLTGVVYVLVMVDKDGTVKNAAVEQVNLTSYQPGWRTDVMRKILADAALKPTSRWTFHVPTTGKQVSAPYWLARVPVAFTSFGDSRREPFGQWQTYLRGPRQSISWVDNPSLLASNPDTVPDGAVKTVGLELRKLEGSDGT